MIFNDLDSNYFNLLFGQALNQSGLLDNTDLLDNPKNICAQ